ncbi:MAG: TauD/TfdA family dioxygenase [Acidiferrobacterales bacterium]|nr:TauD/TfdA family dioxygenase [Acidiferrobacterales bacterium]
MNILDLSHEQSSGQLECLVDDGFAWTNSEIDPLSCVVPVSDEVRREILKAAEVIDANPLPTLLRRPDQFEIPKTVELMTEIRERLDSPPGVAVIDSFPLDDLSIEQAIDVFWIVGQKVGRHVAQKWDGTMIYHVRDTGVEYGYGVRGSYTKVELLFHNDNAFGIALPHYVGLMCIRPSVEGGLSRFCSLYSIHNQMLSRYPAELKRLYQPVLWDRQAEHAQGEPIVVRAPVFRFENNRLWTRANPSLIRKGYDVAGFEMDAETSDAVHALKEVSEESGLWFELPIERGHLQYINNIDIAHYRSEIVDHPDPSQKRHLVRSWHRDLGLTSYDG